MPTTYKGLTVPLPTDLADGPKAFQDYTDSLPASDALAARDIPAGTIVFSCAATAPAGWLLLDGSTVVGAATTYPKLWNVVPTSWRHANGTDLILPDARGRLLIGLLGTDTSIDTIGEKVGARTKVLTTANLPPHGHAQQGSFTTTNPTRRHHHGSSGGGQLVETYFGAGLQLPAGNGARAADFTGQDVDDHEHVVALSGNTGNGPGTSAAVDITPPVIVFNVLMRAS